MCVCVCVRVRVRVCVHRIKIILILLFFYTFCFIFFSIMFILFWHVSLRHILQTNFSVESVLEQLCLFFTIIVPE